MDYTEVLDRIGDSTWELPTSYKEGMLVPGRIFADDSLLRYIRDDPSVEQVANVAFLPGIVGASLAMPDIHWGYGFPIGGVAATDIRRGGVVSPGGVGFDINCGVRLLRTELSEEEVRPHLRDLVAALFRDIHTGTGSGQRLKLSPQDVTGFSGMAPGGPWSEAWAIRTTWTSRRRGAASRRLSTRALETGQEREGGRSSEHSGRGTTSWRSSRSTGFSTAPQRKRWASSSPVRSPS